MANLAAAKKLGGRVRVLPRESLRGNDIMAEQVAAQEMSAAELPIKAAREEILSLVQAHSFSIVVGDTGSGKTTQLPVYLLEADKARSEDLLCPVAITQPRRVAATSVAARVATNLSTEVGSKVVGYKVRFDSRVHSGGSKLTFMTDGVLVRECVVDPWLSRYRTIMLDEVHERSVETDVLLGLVKRAVLRRHGELRCIVSSATLNTEQFRAYFGQQSPVLRVPGRLYQVDVYHSRKRQTMTRYGPANRDYVEAAVDVASQIHSTQPPGHILIFLTGQDEIEKACQLLRAATHELELELRVLPLYSALPREAADAVFEAVDEQRVRKVVIATNIAETSITVPGIKYVVDSGYVKLKGFEPSRSVASLTVVPVSKVAAEQRAGRAGRTGPGQCYRLYSKACFDEMQPETLPEIKRSSMASVALVLKSLDIDDVVSFDFLDPPDPDQLACALLELHALGALDTGPKLTSLGRNMARLALEPNLARALLEAARQSSSHSVVEGALSICAMLSSEDVWLSPQRRNSQYSDEDLRIFAAHVRFRDAKGDLFSLLNVYESYEARKLDAPSWARSHFLRFRALQFAKRARLQLRDELDRITARWPRQRRNSGNDEFDRQLVHALCAGLCLNAATRGLHADAYVLLPSPAIAQLCRNADDQNQTVSLVRIDDATSMAFTSSPKAICFHELKIGHSSRGPQAHNLLVVDPPDILDTYRARLGTADLNDLNGKGKSPTHPEQQNDQQSSHGTDGDQYIAHELQAPANTNTSSSSRTAALQAARSRFLDRKRRRTDPEVDA